MVRARRSSMMPNLRMLLCCDLASSRSSSLARSSASRLVIESLHNIRCGPLTALSDSGWTRRPHPTPVDVSECCSLTWVESVAPRKEYDALVEFEPVDLLLCTE